MKRFEFNPPNDSEVHNTTFNRSGIYDNNRVTYVAFWIDAFQSHANGRKGFGEPQRIHISFHVDQDPSMSGTIQNFQVRAETFDRQSMIMDLGEVDPTQLFWIGRLFLKVAKHYEICLKQQIEANNEMKDI
jgi:hypothetical protein